MQNALFEIQKTTKRIGFAQDNFPNLRCFTATKLAEPMLSKDDSHVESGPRHLVPLQNAWEFAMAMRKDVVGRTGLQHQ